jgi:hypothetical protein
LRTLVSVSSVQRPSMLTLRIGSESLKTSHGCPAVTGRTVAVRSQPLAPKIVISAARCSCAATAVPPSGAKLHAAMPNEDSPTLKK